MNWKTTLTTGAVALGVLGSAAYAQPQMQPVHGGAGPGQGYGMMGPGSGFGGMGGYGMGPGMMGGWGGHMGPGMMGGWGPGGRNWDGHMGPGMMGGYGPYGGIGGIDLTDSQRQQVRKIEDETRRKNWELMGRMQDEMARQRDAWEGSKVDRAAVTASNKRMFELRQQMLENRLDAQDKIEGVLTPEQRAQLEKRSRAWRGGTN